MHMYLPHLFNKVDPKDMVHLKSYILETLSHLTFSIATEALADE